MQLVEVFEGFSAALLPFVQNRNIDLIKQFMAFAQQAQAANDAEDEQEA
jgi:hypothetical protein